MLLEKKSNFHFISSHLNSASKILSKSYLPNSLSWRSTCCQQGFRFLQRLPGWHQRAAC